MYNLRFYFFIDDNIEILLFVELEIIFLSTDGWGKVPIILSLFVMLQYNI